MVQKIKEEEIDIQDDSDDGVSLSSQPSDNDGSGYMANIAWMLFILEAFYTVLGYIKKAVKVVITSLRVDGAHVE